MRFSFLSSVLAVALAHTVHAADEPVIAFDNSGFVLASPAGALPLLLDAKDAPAVHLAAASFAEDVYAVTGQRMALYNDSLPQDVKRAVIVGTVKSDVVRQVGRHRTAMIHADNQVVISQEGGMVNRLEGKWESYEVEVVEAPLPGLDEGLVIAGSDRRGTVYALYTLAEQIGISPWTYFLDVPTPHHEAVSFSRAVRLQHGEPTVKYRGIFLNDEQPVLWNWAKQHFGPGKGVGIAGGDAPFGVDMYRKIFELVLRLKGNYVWPAMWASMFSVDGLDTFPDPLAPGPNQLLADRMGIVMGTSHHEPMGRNQQEWKTKGQGAWSWLENEEELREFWTEGVERGKGLENVWTVGMRGDGDLPLPEAGLELVKMHLNRKAVHGLPPDITRAQQDILKRGLGADELAETPQMWAMYKEVMGYFANGLEIPPNVTPLLADDNWGNLMAVVPKGTHPAGGGVYYHVDYVGQPRNYKWISTASLAKMWEQLNIARHMDTTQIWVLNVGDLKFLETPTEWFLSLAYDFDRFDEKGLVAWFEDVARRDFGVAGSAAGEVGDIMGTYSMYAARRKAELVDPDTYSLINFEEDRRILDDWTTLRDRAIKVYDGLAKRSKLAFYQTVLLPIELQLNVNDLNIAVAKSRLFATQGRSAANLFADHARDCLDRDHELTEAFHALKHGKWNHTLSQPHFNYQYWQSPVRESLPPVSYVSAKRPTFAKGQIVHTRITVEESKGAWPGDNQFNCPDGYDCPDPTVPPMDRHGHRRWVDVSSGGPMDVDWWVTKPVWVRLSKDHGILRGDGTAEERVYIDIDWDALDASWTEGEHVLTGHMVVEASDGTKVSVSVPAKRVVGPAQGWHGAVEGDGYVAIEAAHHTAATHYRDPEAKSGSVHVGWKEIPYYGRTLSGLTMLPVKQEAFEVGEGPSVDYDFWLTSTPGEHLDVEIHIGPSLNFVLGERLAYGLSLDGGDIRVIHPVPESKPGTLPDDWEQVVSEELRVVRTKMDVDQARRGTGARRLTVWGMSSGIVLQRVVVNMGGLDGRTSYLGPPESVIV